MKIKIKKIQIISMMVLLTCLNISYLNMKFGGLNNLFFLIRICLIIGFILIDVLRKTKYSNTFKVIILFFIWILFVTAYNHQDFVDALSSLSIPFLLTLYLDRSRNTSAIHYILSSWNYLLLILCLLDLASMFFFPGGLYKTQIYSLNWFLGYKTARLVYILPLCIIEAILSYWKNAKLSIKSYCVFLLALITLAYSQATAAFASLLLICLFIVWLNLSRRQKMLKKIIWFILDYRIVLTICIFVNVLIVLIQNNPTIQFIITNIFKKDATLSTRTIIWERCFDILRENWISGIGFLSGTNYENLLGSSYYSSPHNMALSIMMTGGAVALIFYIIIAVLAWKQVNNRSDFYCIFSCLGCICVLIVGVTSSSIVFSMCGFIFFILMQIQLSEKRNKRKDNELWKTKSKYF